MSYCTTKTMSQTRGKAMQNRFRCKEKGASEEAPAQRAENICIIVALHKVRKNNGSSVYGGSELDSSYWGTDIIDGLGSSPATLCITPVSRSIPIVSYMPAELRLTSDTLPLLKTMNNWSSTAT